MVASDDFYGRVDNLAWYLHCTEEMPVAVEEHIQKEIKKIEQCYQKLRHSLDKALSSTA